MKLLSQNLQIKATFYQSFNPSCTKGGGGGWDDPHWSFKHNFAENEPKLAKFLLI